MDSNMVLVNTSGLMAPFIEEIGTRENFLGKAIICVKMADVTRAHGKTTKCMVKEPTNGQTAPLTPDNIITAKNRVKVSKLL